MSDMGPSLRDLAKFAGLAVGLTKQTLVDALVQFLCTRPLSTDQQDWIHQCQQLWTGRTDGVPSDAEMRACMPSTSSCIDFFVVTHQEDAAKLAARHWSYDRWVRDAAALVAEVFAAAAQLLLGEHLPCRCLFLVKKKQT